ncbi:MAG: polysaccharide biosynthesis/export family protein [Verrucomicrobiia bacterium]
MTPDFLFNGAQSACNRLQLAFNGAPACSRLGVTKAQRLTNVRSRFQTGAPSPKMPRHNPAGRGRPALPFLVIVILLVIVIAPSASVAAAAQPLPPSASPAIASPAIAAQPFAPSASPIALSPAPSALSSLDDKHKLAIGDRLSFRIVEDLEDPAEPLEPKQLIVADSGELEVPYLGRFPAEGKTCKQLARELKAALEKDYYHQATVMIAVDLMARTRGKVYLVGPVRVPGPQDIPSDEVLTLSKAIMRAGGFNDYANKKNVKVTRRGTGPGETDKKTFIVDVGEILEKGRVERDLVLEPGDLILVPENLIRF